MDKCERENPNENSANLGETIELTLNESVKFKSEDLTITFDENADSRCPTGVNCIQAGKAKISLKVTKGDQTETLTLEAKGLCEADDGSCGSEGAANGYTIKLINVYPYPSEPKPQEAKPIYAKLIVSK